MGQLQPLANRCSPKSKNKKTSPVLVLIFSEIKMTKRLIQFFMKWASSLLCQKSHSQTISPNWMDHIILPPLFSLFMHCKQNKIYAVQRQQPNLHQIKIILSILNSFIRFCHLQLTPSLLLFWLLLCDA